MSQKITIELDCKEIDWIAVCALKSAIERVENDLQIRKDGEANYGFFHKDKRKDLAEINRHIDAFYLALKYFGGKK